MGEFKAANLWLKVALWMIDMSMFMDLFAHAVGAVGTWSSVRTCLILGFICMLVSVTLVQGLVFLNELKDNKIALICLIVFALLGGMIVFLIKITITLHINKYFVYCSIGPITFHNQFFLLGVFGRKRAPSDIVLGNVCFQTFMA